MVFYRRLPEFKYLDPGTLGEAVALLNKYKQNARIIAGGTDILVQMKCREIAPKYLIGLNNISELDYIRYRKSDGLRLGALATIGSVEQSPVVRERYSILAQAVHSMASEQIRNVATVAGNLCSAVPSADTAPSLMVLGAELKLISPQGERLVNIEKFFVGPGQTVLKAAELLAEIHIPEPSANSGSIYLKRTLRRAMNLATAGVAVLAVVEAGHCQNIRIALGAVAPTPVRAQNAEAMLRGKKLSDRLIEEAAAAAAAEAHPISDKRASAAYRRELIRVMTLRALKQACGKKE